MHPMALLNFCILFIFSILFRELLFQFGDVVGDFRFRQDEILSFEMRFLEEEDEEEQGIHRVGDG